MVSLSTPLKSHDKHGYYMASNIMRLENKDIFNNISSFAQAKGMNYDDKTEIYFNTLSSSKFFE